MMPKKFIMTLTKHRIMGTMLKPYLVEEIEDDKYEIVTNILSEEIEANNYTEEQNKLIKWTLQCSEKEVCRVFSKNTMVNDFFAQLKNNTKQLNYVNEYLEKRLFKCFNILYDADIPLYYLENEQIYEADRVKIEKELPQPVFNFQKDNSGLKYHLTIKLKDEYLNLFHNKFTVINNSPCVIIINKRVFYFRSDENFDAKKLQPFFSKKYIEIPKQVEKKYLQTFVKKAIENFTVKATGFKIEVLKPKPDAILTLEKDWRNNFVLILKFKYYDKSISPNSRIKSFVTFNENNDNKEFTKIVRNYEFETEKLNILNNFIELEEDINNIYKINNEYLESGLNMQNWLNSNYKLLIDSGFKLDQNFYKKKYFIEDIRLELNLKDNKDWFDLRGTVCFGDQKIPFIALKNHLINGIKEFVLPNQEIAILPDEWFEKYTEVFQVAKVENEALKINKVHLQYLEENLEEIDKEKIIKAHKLQHLKPSLSEYLKANLRNYQEAGYHWLYSLYSANFGACLADDMGLGKTVQTLAFILKILETNNSQTIKQTKNIQLSFFDNLTDNSTKISQENAGIIIMPTSLIHNWANEIKKFAPKLNFLIYSGSDRTNFIKYFDNYNIILTSYGVARNDIEFLSNYYYKFVVLDESQFIKNPKSKIYSALSQLNTEFKMILTGTPIENSLIDLWAQINFINPQLLGDLRFFKKEFVYHIIKTKNKDEQILKRDKLKKIISPFILRRKKEEVLEDLPDLTESVIYCEMSAEQKKLYEAENTKIKNSLLQSIDKQNIAEYNMIVLRGLLRLRQLANNPKLLALSETEKAEYEDFDNINSGKYDEVLWTIENLVAEKNKVLIFSSFVKHLELYEEYFESRNWNFAKLTGQTKNRETEIDKFTKDDDCLLFLISLKAGGVGLNLTAAKYVMFLDPWWNPAVENQAIARAHRIGQTNKLMVYRFITENSIEQKIMKLQESKKELADTFINDNNPLKKLSQQEILELF